MGVDWTIIGNCRLACGDCREILPTLSPGEVDAVVTDPPYGISLSSHSGRACMDGSERRRKRETSIASDESLEAAVEVAGYAMGRRLPLAMFFSPYRPLPMTWRNVLVWDKGSAVGGGGDPATCWKRTFELIGVWGNGPLREKRGEAVLRFWVNTGADFEHHPCQKPVRLMSYLIRQLTDPGETVLDPFMGSGATGLAAVTTGRRFVGVESDPGHFATACRRIERAVSESKCDLFAGVA